MLGPVFRLELVTTARPARVAALRAGYVAVLGWTLWTSYERLYDQGDVVTLQAVARFAAAFFSNFAWLQLLAVVGLGPALAAGAIAADRERGTLEHLFPTTLANREIVLGKLGVRLLHVGFVVLAGMPVLAAAMIMGGIAPASLAVVFLSTASTLVAVVSLSLCLSVWSARVRPAVTSSYLVVFGLLLLPLGMRTWRNASSWFQVIHDRWLEGLGTLLVQGNPFWSLSGHLYGDWLRQRDAWGSTLLLVRNQLALSAVCLAVAVLSLRRAHQATLDQGRWQRGRRRWRLAVWQGFPLAWKEMFAERATDRLGTVGRTAVALSGLALTAATAGAFRAGASRGSAAYFDFSSQAGTLVACFGLLWLVSRGASLVTSERQRQTWDTLLGLPISPGQIVLGKLLGNLYAGRWLLFALAVVWGLGGWFRPAQLLSAGASLALFLILAWFGSAVGLWFSFGCQSSLRAMVGAVGTCLFVGGGYLMLFYPVVSGRGESVALFLAPCVPALFAVAHDVGRLARGSSASPGLGLLLLGAGCYLAAAALLTLAAVQAFGRLTGRLEPPGALARGRASPAGGPGFASSLGALPSESPSPQPVGASERAA
jgi:ABC-type transport system involved in multi-copper enzyme maturation permease subunit